MLSMFKKAGTGLFFGAIGWFFASGLDDLMQAHFDWFSPSVKIGIAVAAAMIGFYRF